MNKLRLNAPPARRTNNYSKGCASAADPSPQRRWPVVWMPQSWLPSSCQVRVYWSHCVESLKLHEAIVFGSFVLLVRMYNNDWRELWSWLRADMSCRVVSKCLFLLLSGMGPGDCVFWWWSEHASCESLSGLAVTYRLLRASMFYRDASEGLLFTLGLGTSESLLVTKRTCILWTLVMGCVWRAQCCALSCFIMMRTTVCVLLLRLRPSYCLFWY